MFDGMLYYVRLTVFCVSPMFDCPFLSLYLQCDERDIFECQIYILADIAHSVLLDTNWTEAPVQAISDILDYAHNHKNEWIREAEAASFYVKLADVTPKVENMSHVYIISRI